MKTLGIITVQSPLSTGIAESSRSERLLLTVCKSTTCAPYVPGSSIRGRLRSLMKQESPECTITFPSTGSGKTLAGFSLIQQLAEISNDSSELLYSSKSEIIKKTLVIGLGGTGLAVIRELGRLVVERYELGLQSPEVATVKFLYIDTYENALTTYNRSVLAEDVRLVEGEKVIVTEDSLQAMVESPEDYPDMLSWLSSIRNYDYPDTGRQHSLSFSIRDSSERGSVSSRSLRTAQDNIESVNLAMKRKGFPSQNALAQKLGMARSTISNFMNGRPIDFLNFTEICRVLDLDWVHVCNNDNSSRSAPNSFSNLMQETRQKVSFKEENRLRCSSYSLSHHLTSVPGSKTTPFLRTRSTASAFHTIPVSWLAAGGLASFLVTAFPILAWYHSTPVLEIFALDVSDSGIADGKSVEEICRAQTKAFKPRDKAIDLFFADTTEPTLVKLVNSPTQIFNRCKSYTSSISDTVGQDLGTSSIALLERAYTQVQIQNQHDQVKPTVITVLLNAAEPNPGLPPLDFSVLGQPSLMWLINRILCMIASQLFQGNTTPVISILIQKAEPHPRQASIDWVHIQTWFKEIISNGKVVLLNNRQLWGERRFEPFTSLATFKSSLNLADSLQEERTFQIKQRQERLRSNIAGLYKSYFLQDFEFTNSKFLYYRIECFKRAKEKLENECAADIASIYAEYRLETNEEANQVKNSFYLALC